MGILAIGVSSGAVVNAYDTNTIPTTQRFDVPQFSIHVLDTINSPTGCGPEARKGISPSTICQFASKGKGDEPPSPLYRGSIIRVGTHPTYAAGAVSATSNVQLHGIRGSGTLH